MYVHKNIYNYVHICITLCNNIRNIFVYVRHVHIFHSIYACCSKTLNYHSENAAHRPPYFALTFV